MSSIRIFVLGALVDSGEMHGHQLRQLAEQEHIDQWTDISVGALYGAIKRLAADELIEEVRTEQVGGYPERIIWRITDGGRATLRELRQSALEEIVVRPDPFDLAIARPDPDSLDDVTAVVAERTANLRAMLEHSEAHTARIAKYLTDLERMVMRHRADHLRADIAWHDDLLEQLPQLLEAHDRQLKEAQT